MSVQTPLTWKPKEGLLALWAAWEKEHGETLRPAVRRLKKSAIARFDELGFPGPRNEEWRFTQLGPVLKTPLALPAAETALTQGDVARLVPATPEAAVYVFVNGRLQPRLSQSGPLPAGVVVADLATALVAHADLVEHHLGRQAKFDQHPFVALNTALFVGGAFVVVPAGVTVEMPLHLIFISDAAGEPVLAAPRSVIWIGNQARLDLVQTHVGLPGQVYLHAGVTEISVGASAAVRHAKLQRESRDAFHLDSLFVQLQAGSQFTSQAINDGGSVVRNDITATFDAERAECTLNGLTLASGAQHVVNHTTIDHAQPHCNSHEMYKNVIAGQARVVFNGKIFVRKHAQKTDAKQSNQTLLLSEDGTIHTKPQLEIFADDVKCTHGATVGQLDDAALFYCQARGLGRQQAEQLLTYAFANEIIQQVPLDSLRAALEAGLLGEALPAASG